MGGHHKKNLRAEKAKVKLKGAKLPKGLNVTKTDFKVRKIVIRDQLRGAVSGVDGEVRQVNLKETLSRLKHHGSNFRLEAMRNVREAVANQHPGIVGQLNEVIQGVAAGCLDLEREPRRESFKTLASILGGLSNSAVAPFFHIISSYLRCAMTHIQPQLQEDSLLMLDVLLQHVPVLVAQHSGKIFHHFLEMISRVRAEGNSGNRVLNVNMGQKQTTIKWRSKVLQRLQQMLQTLVEHSSRSSKEINQNSHGRTCHFNSKETHYFTIKRSIVDVQRMCDLSSIFCSGMGKQKDTSASNSVEHNSDDGLNVGILRNYVEHLLPLLTEAWMEVRPLEEMGRTNSQIVLSAEAATTLHVVLEIIENLWMLVRMHETEMHTNDLSASICNEYSDLFASNFMLPLAFPYQQSEQPTAQTERRGKNKTLQKAETLCYAENLGVVYLMSEFFAAELVQREAAKFCQLLDYLNAVLQDLRPQQSAEYFRLIEKCLRAYLIDNAINLLMLDAEKMRLLLRATITALLNNRFNKSDGGAGISARILILLCEIVRTPLLFEAFGLTEFTDFLAFLPQLLLRPSISESSLDAMSTLGKQKNECFLKSLAQQSTAILQNLQQIQVSGALNAFEGKKQILNLFFWLDGNARLERANELIDEIQRNCSDKRIIGYGQFILSQC